MIIETPYKQYDTVTVKTVTGEELVCRFVEETDSHLTIEKPLALTATQDGMGLVPYAFTIHKDAKIKLNKSAVTFVHKTEESMAKSYVESTSGIKLS